MTKRIYGASNIERLCLDTELNGVRNALTGAGRRILAPMARWRTRKSIRILMYHRFGLPNQFRRLGTDVFDAQLRYLRRHYVPMSLSEVVRRLRAGDEVPEKAVALTVDDGYRDFFEHAYPVLRRHRIPATLFVVTKFVEQAIWLWFDALRYLIETSGRVTIEWQRNGEPRQYSLRDATQRHQLWLDIAAQALEMVAEERAALLRSVERALDVSLPDVPTDEYAAVTWHELGETDPEIVEIGSHTCTHPKLMRCAGSELRYEVETSKAEIEERLGREVALFCYPNGTPSDYDARCVGMVEKAGYQGAVVAHGGLIPEVSDLYTLNRMAASENWNYFQSSLDGLSVVKDSFMRTSVR